MREYIEVGNRRLKFSPSLMCMDYLNIGRDISVLNRFFDSFHVDIMDGHFCKSIHLSPEYVRSISTIAQIPIEVHLMVENPDDYISDLIDCGADMIIIHVESAQQKVFRIINQIKSAGKSVGIALCPATPVECIRYMLGYVDKVTVLNVDIGFVGQKLIPEMLVKTREINTIRRQEGYTYVIQADGGVSEETFSSLVAAGVDDFVIGKKALFSKGSNTCDCSQQFYKDFRTAMEMAT